MGIITLDLGLPAILYNQPGLTKEELALQQLNSMPHLVEISIGLTKSSPFDTFNMDSNLRMLADELNLPPSKDYVDFMKTSIDKNGIEFLNPSISEDKTTVFFNETNSLGPLEEIVYTNDSPPTENMDICTFYDEYLVKKVLEVSEIIDCEDNREYKILANQINRKWKKESFSDTG